MSDRVGNPEDRFSHDEAQVISLVSVSKNELHHEKTYVGLHIKVLISCTVTTKLISVCFCIIIPLPYPSSISTISTLELSEANLHETLKQFTKWQNKLPMYD